MIRKRWQKALVGILLAEAVGLLSSLLAGPIKPVYEALTKPPLAPPGWLFGVVWPILFALIGYAAYRVYASPAGRLGKNRALAAYALQLIVNFFWPIIFFRFKLLWGAAAVLALLIILVIITLLRFRQADRLAAKLLLPYLIWLLFAFYLNVGVALLN